MKRFILFTFSILLTFTFAIAQDGINYQGAATDANGDELTNQSITIRASVLSGSANGNLEWEETHSATTDQFGLFNVVIGQGTNTTNGATALFDDMDWGSGNHFLKIEMDASGGTNYAMIGTTQMMSVPYALYAKSAGIDSAMLAGMIGSSVGGMGGGCDFNYPHDISGSIITERVEPSLSYTVPSGKVFYLMNVYTYASDLEVSLPNGSFGRLDAPSGKPIILSSNQVIKTDQNYANINGYLVDENYFANCGGGGGGGSSSSASAVDSAMVAGMIANAGGGGTGDWELLYDCLNCGQTLPWGTVDRFGVAESDGFLYVIAHDITVFTGDDFDSTTTAWSGDYNNHLLQNNYPALIPLKKDMSWHIQFHSAGGEVRKAYFVPNSGGGSSTVSSSGNGLGCDFKYPDGLDGEVVNLDLANDYTVPSGKTLYINHVFLYGEWLKIDGERIIMGYSNSSNLNNSHHPPSNGLNSPLIVGSGSVLSVENGYATDQQIQGILMDEGVQVMNLDLANDYTVPSGKTLYLTNIYLYGDYLYLDGERIIMGYSNSSNLNNSHHPPSNGLNSPLIVGSGSVLSVENGYSTDQQVNGYLVDENYFANCGGGGSSSNSGSAGLDSVTVATMIANAVSATNSSTSVSTFGDTLFINGQSIIIPGISLGNINPVYSSVTDIDGNIYQTVKHGDIEIMTENLRVENFNNGDPIPEQCFCGTNTNSMCSTPGWAYYNCNASVYSSYGKTYIGYTVSDPRNMCPIGWHINTPSELSQLFNLFVPVETGGVNIGAILESGTNESGLSFKQGGAQSAGGTGNGMGQSEGHWTSAGYYYISSSLTGPPDPSGTGGHNYDYLYIRCVKD